MIIMNNTCQFESKKKLIIFLVLKMNKNSCIFWTKLKKFEWLIKIFTQIYKKILRGKTKKSMHIESFLVIPYKKLLDSGQNQRKKIISKKKKRC